MNAVVTLSFLRAAAARQHEALTVEVDRLVAREERDLARAVAEKTAVSCSAWKERHALDLRRRATAGVLAAIDSLIAET
jgi:hypothetical protein